MRRRQAANDIEYLRARRGTEQVTFNDIADHLRDYVDRYPADREAVERLACFLAEVERVCHDHNAHPTRGLAGIPEREVPRV